MNARHALRLFLRKIKYEGLSEALVFSFKRVLGIQKRERRLDTLYHIINHCIDITKIPPATGDLRTYQLYHLSLLRAFDAICKKYNWTYWLDAGTLLGAVRHKGFIPWDDDIDIAMPRKDYVEFIKKRPEIRDSYGSNYLLLWGSFLVMAGFEYVPAFVHVDVFPFDEIYSGSDKNDEAEDRKLVEQKINKYQNFYYSHTKAAKALKPEEQERIINERNSIFSGGGGAYLAHSPEFYFQDSAHDTGIFKPEYIFPLSTIQFEGYTFPSPNNPDKYLTEQFGDYMSFPREGALHHDGLSKAFKRSKDDLDSHAEKIADIEKFFTSRF